MRTLLLLALGLAPLAGCAGSKGPEPKVIKATEQRALPKAPSGR